MTRTATSRRRLLIAAAAASVLSGLATPAVASVDSGQAQAADARSQHQQVVDYWTAERRASATPREVVLAGGPAKPTAGKKPGGGGGGGTTTTVTGATWTGDGYAERVTGKVFFRIGSSRYVCSGSAVATATGKNVVLTAGHCLRDGGAAGAYVTDWIFYPGYTGSETAFPYGRWTATSLHTTSLWATTTNGYDDDAGFAVVTDGSAAGFTTTLGVSVLPSVAFSLDHNAIFTSLGYPAAGRKYNGNVLTYCEGPVSPDRDANDTLAMSCDMTGGSSGGPWFRNYLGGDRVITSLNSYGYQSLKNVMFGPIFGIGEQRAFDEAANGTCETDEVCQSVA